MNAKRVYLFLLLVIVAVVLFSLFLRLNSKTSAAENTTVHLVTSGIRRDSVMNKSNITAFSLFSNGQALYKSSTVNQEAVYQFLQKNISVAGAVNVSEVQDLLPENFLKEAVLIKFTKDADDPFLKKNNITSDKEHYYYRQQIGGIPVYGSSVAVHVQKGNEIYSITGVVVKDTPVELAQFNEQSARDTVVQTFADNNNINPELVKILSSERVVFNGMVMGTSASATNLPAVSFAVEAHTKDTVISNRYIVSRRDNTVLLVSDYALPALTRNIYNCTSVNTGCTLLRGEGAPPTGDAVTDSIYDFLGTTYNFYLNRFGRDSYDGVGSPIRTERLTCQWIAAWYGPPTNTMVYCAGQTPYIEAVTHEFTHGILNATPGLSYATPQSASIHEGVSTLMASGVKPEDDYADAFNTSWSELNESLRMFAQGYNCDGSKTVHYNGFVLRHAFYLMGHGGDYNTCNVQPIGKTKSLNVWYRMITTYLQPVSNFRTVYDGMVQACIDLYGATSSDCQSVTNAMKAVEIDQEPVGDQQGAKCIGVVPQAPLCINPPTTTPPPVCILKSTGDANCDSKISVSDFTIWKSEFIGKCSSTNLTPTACGTDVDNNGSLMDADFNADTKVSTSDFTTWKSEFLRSRTP